MNNILIEENQNNSNKNMSKINSSAGKENNKENSK